VRSRLEHFGFRIADCGFVSHASFNPQSSIRNPRSRRAFTLLELMVAMTMMVAVATCLYTSLYTGFRAYRSAQSSVEPTFQAINAIELLKEDISGVLPPGSHLAGAFIGTDAQGAKGVDNDSLEFYTTHIYTEDGQTTAGGLGKIELLLEDDPNGSYGDYMLIRRMTLDLLSTKAVQPEEQVLCRNVVSLNLRYFDGDDWIDDWDSTADANSLPRAVEVEVQIAHNGTAKTNRNAEPQNRRLIQSFAMPCEAAPATTEETTQETGSGA
jgi:type II secretion system protein J